MGAILNKYPPLRSLFGQDDRISIHSKMKSQNKNYLTMTSATSSPYISANSPLSLTPKHEESLNALQRQLMNDPKGSSPSFNKPRRASLLSSVANLTNSIIGAGILGLPFAMSKAGIICALFLILFFASLTFLSLYFLMYCSRHFPISGHSSFYNLSTVFLPKIFQKMMDISVAFNCFGFMVSYIMISSDMLQSLAKQFIHDSHSILLNRAFLISIFLIIFILPIVQFKHLDNFKFVSIIAILCFVWITIIIVLYAFVPDLFITNSIQTVSLKLFPTEFLTFIGILPIYTFGFLCHQNAFSITNELSNNSMDRLNVINGTTIMIVSTIYILVSFCSYYSFGDMILSDALNNYPENEFIFIVTRVLLIIAILFSFPTASHPARDSISCIIYKVRADQLNKCRYNMLTYIIVILAYIIAILVDNLAIVFSFIGATAGTVISYIFPGLIYYFMFKHNPTHRLSCLLALSLTAFGCILMPFALVCIFMSNS